jgi:hypothetical protein
LAAVDDFFVVLFSLTTTLSYECNQILEAIIIVVIIIAGGFVAKHIEFHANGKKLQRQWKIKQIKQIK